ncbi:TFIIB-type zinc finger domain-containing protein [Loigolactobacillus binensis]|uniref:TFIIB-type zinc finger domain-containing protein n=1 Tax=Loigolactobacillus binensis TaxID=2559922 RepID=A0ABW3EC16_9LACO|nr:TFIIB-type zinc finger domain-containing protein [Loigolactobacillus binensis]
MHNFKCKNCGASDFSKIAGNLVCNYCDSTFIPEKQEKQTTISLDSDIENLLRKIETDPANASLYANLILDIDPMNQEILKYL